MSWIRSQRAAAANIQTPTTPVPLLFEDEDDSKSLERSVEVAPTSHLSILNPGDNNRARARIGQGR